MSSPSREASLWVWLKKAIPIFKHKLHMNRVENSVMRGMPDVEGCMCGNQFWIELKVVGTPARQYTILKPTFQPAQLPWLRRRTKAGGRAFVLLQVGSGRGARRYLLRSDDAQQLEDGLTETAIHDLSVVDPKATAERIVQVAATITL